MVDSRAEKFAEFKFWRFWSIRIKKGQNTAKDLFHARGTAWAKGIENLREQITTKEGTKLATDDRERKHSLFRLSNGRPSSTLTLNERKKVLSLLEKNSF